MKFGLLFHITLFICLFLMHSINDAIAACRNANGPEYVRIFYANGMNNKPEHMREGRAELEKILRNSTDFDYGLAVNQKEGDLKQLYEVALQRQIEPKQIWQWIFNIGIAPTWFKDALVNYTHAASTVSYALDADLRRMVADFLADLSSGKMVVIVAHSQGNFYANAAYDYIYRNYEKYRNSIGIVAVGSPASIVQGGGPHTNNSMDLIVNLVGLVYPVLPATGSYDEPGSDLNHNFVLTYLTAFGSKIKGDIITTIERLQPPEKTFECKDPAEVPVNVITTGATNISSHSAFLNGYVQSGKQIAVYCMWKKSQVPYSCESIKDKYPSPGPYPQDTNDSFYCIADGLDQNSTYYYRVCGHEGDRVSDGGAVMFKTNISCDSSLDASGGTEGLSVNFGMGPSAGYALVEFEAYTVPDKLEIWHGGQKIFTTEQYTSNGYVSGYHSANVWHNPSLGQEWEVYVFGNSIATTAWDLTISCPN